MKIKTAGDLLTASTRGWGKGKEKIVPSFFFLALRPRSCSQCTRVRDDFRIEKESNVCVQARTTGA